MPKKYIKRNPKRFVKRRKNNMYRMVKRLNYLSKINKPETKYFSNYFTSVGIDGNGSLNTSLCYPAQGLTAVTRIGDSIRVKSLTIRGSWAHNGSDSVCRVIIFYDYENTINGVANFLDNSGTTVATFSSRTQSYLYNAKTIYDRSFSITADNALRSFSATIKINKITKFTPGATGIQKGALKLIAITNELYALPLFAYKVFVTYTDA